MSDIVLYTYTAYEGVPDTVLQARGFPLEGVRSTVVLFAQRVIIEQEGRQADRNLNQGSILRDFGIYCASDGKSALFLEILKKVPQALMRDKGIANVLQWGGIQITECNCKNMSRLDSKRAPFKEMFTALLMSFDKEKELKLLELGHGDGVGTALALYEAFSLGFKKVEISLLEQHEFPVTTFLNGILGGLSKSDPSFQVEVQAFLDFESCMQHRDPEEYDLVFAEDFETHFTYFGGEFFRNLQARVGEVPILLSAQGATLLYQPEMVHFEPGTNIQKAYDYLNSRHSEWKEGPMTLMVKQTRDYKTMIQFASGLKGRDFKVLVVNDECKVHWVKESHIHKTIAAVNYFLPGVECTEIPYIDGEIFTGRIIAFVPPVKRLKPSKAGFAHVSVNLYFKDNKFFVGTFST